MKIPGLDASPSQDTQHEVTWSITTPHLTTASQNGGWVPAISRSFHYWQPAPRWRLLPWLANPGKPAMSPHAVGRAGTRHTA